jgi:hypothetical protein
VKIYVARIHVDAIFNAQGKPPATRRKIPIPDPAKLYDYSIIKKIYAELKKSWKPKL